MRLIMGKVLTEQLTNANARSGREDPSILLLLEDRPDSLRALVGATKVDGHDVVPLLVRNSGERLVAEDTGVCNEYMNTPKRFEGLLDNAFAVLSRGDCCNCLAAS